jgi:hypothetical protein
MFFLTKSSCSVWHPNDINLLPVSESQPMLIKNTYKRDLHNDFFVASLLSNGHSPQICQNGELLVRMCRMRVTFWRMSANVSSVECIESGEKGWRMSVECIESGENGWRKSGKCIGSGQSMAANVGASKIGRFIYKKRYFYV